MTRQDRPDSPDRPEHPARAGSLDEAEPATQRSSQGGAARPATILQGGRAKAYRPLPREERHAALEAGLAAYGRGDFFDAHELLEPAWMGTDDLGERELLQGLIKLAAAYVHAVRGNQAGVAKNLRGALARLEAGAVAGPAAAIDAPALIGDVRARLEAIEAGTGAGWRPPPEIKRAPREISRPPRLEAP
jgi:hypothetical protein